MNDLVVFVLLVLFLDNETEGQRECDRHSQLYIYFHAYFIKLDLHF